MAGHAFCKTAYNTHTNYMHLCKIHLGIQLIYNFFFRNYSLENVTVAITFWCLTFVFRYDFMVYTVYTICSTSKVEFC